MNFHTNTHIRPIFGQSSWFLTWLLLTCTDVLDFGSVVKDKSSLPVVGVEIPVEMSKNMKEDSAKQYQ